MAVSIRALLASSLITSFILATPSNADDSVGTLAGGFSVSEKGAATYTLPIDLPPGINGMMPRVNISYNSFSGWADVGLSSISLCGKNKADDGYIRSIKYDDVDPYCINGERLVLVGGIFGEVGSRYVPATKPNDRITLRSNELGMYFELKNSSGVTSNFGLTTDSQIKNSSGKTAVWNISESRDVFQNSVSYSYNTELGKQRISSIFYSQYKVEFEYGESSVKKVRYPFPSLKSITDTRLSKISVLDSTTDDLYWDYQIEYVADQYGEKQIKRVLKTTDNISISTGDFGYGPSSSQKLVGVGSTHGQFGYNQGWRNQYHVRTMADVNGDGLEDIIGFAHDGVMVALSKGDGTFDHKGIVLGTYGYNQGWRNEYHVRTMADVNGDGLADIVGFAHPGVAVALSNGDGTFDHKGIVLGTYGHNQGWRNEYHLRTLADVNGDGLADIVGFSSGGVEVALSKGDGTFNSPKRGVSTFNYDSGWKVDLHPRMMADVNGDGLADIVGFAHPGVVVALSNGDGTFENRGVVVGQYGYNQGWRNQYHVRTTSDVNGDGLADIIGFAHDGVMVALSKGDGTFDYKGIVLGTYGYNQGWRNEYHPRTLRDMNGDGLADIVGFSSGGVEVALSKGDGTFNSPKRGVSTFNYDSGWKVDLHPRIVTDVNGDGLADVVGFAHPGVVVALSNYEKVLLKSISPDIGDEINIFYEDAATADIYSISSEYESKEQLVRITPRSKLVSNVSRIDGLGNVSKTFHKYFDYQIIAEGIGSLGFHQIEITDESTGIRTNTTYSQDWEKRTTGMVEATITYAHDGTVLSESFNQLENHFESVFSDRFLPYNKAVTKIIRDVDGTVLSTTTNEYTLNVNGWLEEEFSCISELDYYATSFIPCSSMVDFIQKKETNYEYYNDPALEAFEPLVSLKSTSITVPIAPPFQPAKETRLVEYIYYPATGKVHHETIQPNDPSLKLTKTYGYHSSGQLESTSVSGPNIATRTSRVEYNPSTKLMEKSINTLGHETSFAYEDARFPWLATRETNPDGQWIKKQFNSWGQVERTEKGHGNTVLEWAASDKNWCEGGSKCSSDGSELFYVSTHSSTSPSSYVYFDQLGRKVRTEALGLKNGNTVPVYTNIQYNALGQVEWSGKPFYEGEAEYGNTIQYDLLGRPDTAVDASLETSTISYDGYATIYTNQKGQTKTVIKNALGQMVEARDHYQNSITYQYDAFGNLIYMNDGHGNRTTMGYNVRGFKTKLVDPDQGTTTYNYSVLGEVIDQVDAKGQVIHTEYDLLGRIKSRTDHYGTANAQTSTWTYDDLSISATAVGKLTAVTNNSNFTRTFEYDAYGRPYKTVATMDGTNYSLRTVFDGLNRVKDTIYPNGYTVRNEYHNELGTLNRIVNPSNNYEFWSVQNTNARGQLTEMTYGGIIANTHWYNDATGLIEDMKAVSTITAGFIYQDLTYDWDEVGNLKSFGDLKQGVSETYSYDVLNRLQDVVATNGTLSTSYDNLGNITSRTGVGSYDYNNVAVPTECGSLNHQAGPHAVRRVTGAQSNFYCYDANGNLVKDKNRTIHYTAFNKPDSISRGSTLVSFDYGPNRGRFKRVDQGNGSTKTTYYFEDYEKVIEGGTTKHKINVNGIAQVIEEQGGSTNIQFMLKDQLGSITAIVNSFGTIVENGNYDAWGNRRLTNLDLISDPFSYDNGITDRGFSGQEHIDSVGLIHMNGRVYDPVISRFISPDPLIQAPSNLQSLNRYSYVWNNPLNATDHSGYYSWDDFEDDVKGVVEDTLAIATFGFVCMHALACSNEVWEGSKDFAETSLHSPRQAFRDSYQSFLEEQRRFHRNEYVVKYGGPLVTYACGPWGALCAGVYAAAVADAHGADPEDAIKEGVKAAAIAWAISEFNDWVDGQTGGSTPSAPESSSPTFTEQLYNTAVDVVKDQLKDGIVAGIKAKSSGDNFNDAFRDSFDLEHALIGELLAPYQPRGLGYGVGRYIDSINLLDSLASYDLNLGSYDFRRGNFRIGQGIVAISKNATKSWILEGGSFTGSVVSQLTDHMTSEAEGWGWGTGLGRSLDRRRKAFEDWTDSIF